MWGGDGTSGGGGGGVSSSQLAGMLIGYATETWVDEHYISIDFFSRLFQAHGTENGSEIDVMPNDLETTITSVESMFGFWTNLYISALGSNGAAPAGISLGMLTDVNISGTPSAGQVLTFDAVSGKWINGNAQAGATALANLTDVTLTSLQANQILIYDATTQKWVNSSVKTINGYSIFGTGDIPASGGGTGNYLPLAGGTMTGGIYWDSYSRIYCTSGYMGIYAEKDVVLRPDVDNGTDAGMELSRNGCTFTGFVNVPYSTASQGKGYKIGGRMAMRMANTGALILSGYNSKIYLQPNGTDRDSIMTIDSNGVGINTDPSYPLHINGTVNLYKSTIRFLFANSDGDGIMINTTRNTNDYYILYLSYGESSLGSVINEPALVVRANGRTGLGVSSPLYKLHVSGDIYATGAITALSDARKKDITGEAGVSVEQIAHAPAVQFLWKDKERRKDGQQVGTLAQYWQTVLPEVVSDKGGELSIQYGVAALVSSIIIARKVANHEVRIDKMEKWMKKWAEENDE
jgi:hypothetical protein